MMEKAKKAPEAFEPDEVNGSAGGRLASKRHPGAHVEPALEAVIQTPKLGARIMRCELTDREWAAIKPMLPNKPRGVPRVNDRRVLNGIFWVLRSGAPWRDLPDAFGPYTTCYNRFVRWRRAGVWATIMDALAGAHDAAVQMIDTSIVRVHQHGACINRNRRQCMGRSRAGLTSKIHALVDTSGLPVQLALTPGEAHDNRLAGKLLSRIKPGSMLLADRGYDADWIRELAVKKGGWANIPPKRNRSEPICFSPYIAPAIELRGSSTGSSNVVGWRPVTTNLPPTTSPSFNSPQSGYGSVLMSPGPSIAPHDDLIIDFASGPEGENTGPGRCPVWLRSPVASADTYLLMTSVATIVGAERWHRHSQASRDASTRLGKATRLPRNRVVPTLTMQELLAAKGGRLMSA